MKPKEKALQIFNKMKNVEDNMGSYPMCFDTAKQCALIAIEYTLEECDTDSYRYLLNVKKQLEKL
jgi:nitrate reductase assembly molybdenum cofactor insertion protein NarJ